MKKIILLIVVGLSSVVLLQAATPKVCPHLTDYRFFDSIDFDLFGQNQIVPATGFYKKSDMDPLSGYTYPLPNTKPIANKKIIEHLENELRQRKERKNKREQARKDLQNAQQLSRNQKNAAAAVCRAKMKEKENAAMERAAMYPPTPPRTKNKKK